MSTDRLREIISEMRSEGPRYKSHDLGYVDSVSSNRVDDWADELEALVRAQEPAGAPAQPRFIRPEGCICTVFQGQHLYIHSTCPVHVGAPAQATAWQPIATAPKNTRVLIGGGGCPSVHENELRCFKSAGCAWGGLGDAQQPTHWMPLPPAPSDASADPEV